MSLDLEVRADGGRVGSAYHVILHVDANGGFSSWPSLILQACSTILGHIMAVSSLISLDTIWPQLSLVSVFFSSAGNCPDTLCCPVSLRPLFSRRSVLTE